MSYPTPERLNKLLSYDPLTGVVTWKVRRPHVSPGDVAGTHNSSGYRQISVDGRFYVAHRIAWAITHGVWPPKQIDHVNGDKDDNRLSNLRLATNSENCWNCRPRTRNTSGFKGVSWVKREGKWAATISAHGKKISLGRFLTREAAHAAYCDASTRLHGEFSNTGNAPYSARA